MRQYLSPIVPVISALLLAQTCAPVQQTSSGAQRDSIIFQGISMLPGIRNGDRLTVDRFDCRSGPSDLKRGDVVAFWFPDDPSKTYVKRLVGLPGETVQLRGGRTFVNGQELAESYVDPKLNATARDEQPTYIKPHYYFVMGDNRDNSSDSRSWGLVPEKYIFAKMVAPR